MFVSVCDGHDDQGLVSEFVGESVLSWMEQIVANATDKEKASNRFWEDAMTRSCLVTENNLQTENLKVGSVGSFMLLQKRKSQ
jgi:hypothetical protein